MNQYFNRINIVVILSLLVPIVGLITAYTSLVFAAPLIPGSVSTTILTTVVFATWLIVFVMFSKRIKSLRNVQGLGSKLGKYFRLTTVRYFLYSILSVALVVIFLVTGDDVVTFFFTANMMLAVLQWPVPSKVCRDLKLKGDEYQMVFYRKDNF
jgi:hypothetical protein